MNKKIILIALALILTSSVSAQKNNPIWEYAEEKPHEITERGRLIPQSESEVHVRIQPFCTNMNIPFSKDIYTLSIYFTDIHAKTLSRVLSEYEVYQSEFSEEFRHAGVPEYLSLACVASTMMNNEVKENGRAGIWQLDSLQAVSHGLTCNDTIDERLLRVKAAKAFANELRSLRDSTGSWAYAAISLRYGKRTLQLAKNQTKSPEKFWDVYKYLPKEIQEYTMFLMGSIYSYYFHKEHKIELKPQKKIKTKQILVKDTLIFSEYQHSNRVPLKILKELNPQYLTETIYGTEDSPLPLEIPKNKIKDTKENVLDTGNGQLSGGSSVAGEQAGTDRLRN